jgi:hypothetical protein
MPHLRTANMLEIIVICSDMSAFVEVVAGTREEVVFQVQIPPHSLSEEVTSSGANIIETMSIVEYTSREVYCSTYRGLLHVGKM